MGMLLWTGNVGRDLVYFALNLFNGTFSAVIKLHENLFSVGLWHMQLSSTYNY
jgi:hypothetical protein